MALFQYFNKVDGNYRGTKLPDPQRALSKEVPSSSISTANAEIAAVLQASAAGAKVVRGTYLKLSAEKKAEIGQRAAEHGVLATVRFYATKLPVPLKESSVRIWKNAYTAQLHRLRQDGKDNAKFEALPTRRRGRPFLEVFNGTCPTVWSDLTTANGEWITRIAWLSSAQKVFTD